MSTLSIRIADGFAPVVSFVEAVLDALADADRHACAARARYPLAD
jgi:hypothetical protein